MNASLSGSRKSLRLVVAVALAAAILLLMAVPVLALNPARLIEITGTPTEGGEITITVGTEPPLEVTLTTGMTGEQICAAVEQAASQASDDFWSNAKIDYLHNSGCYIRIRDGRDGKIGSDVGTPSVTECATKGTTTTTDDTNDIGGVSLSQTTKNDALVKLSGFEAPPATPASTEWTVTITLRVAGALTPFSLIVDNVTTGTTASDHPSTLSEILAEFKALINANTDLIADLNDDDQLLVYIEGTIKILKFESGVNPWGNKNKIDPHPILLGLVPDRGRLEGGELVTAYGSYLGPNATFSFGGIPATVVDYDPVSGLYRVLAPAGDILGAVDVVAVPDGGSQDIWNSLPAGYAYVDVIPTLSEWGLIILATLVLAALVWIAVNRRRRIAAA